MGYNEGVSISWSKRQWLEFIGVLIVAGVVVWFGQKWYSNYRQTQSHEVRGQIQKISPNNIDLNGIYILDTNPEKSDFTHPQPIQVKITSNTKFVKTIWFIPTQAELKKTNGVYYPDKLKQEQQVGSVEDLSLVQGLSITVKTLNNIAGNKTITASEIDYVFRQYPD